MILLDFNQVAISNLFQNLNLSKSSSLVKVEEDLLRHMILNTIRGIVQYNKEKFGKLVICCDNKVYWRKEFYPYYKSNRKRDRDNSGLDWESFFVSLNKIKAEIIEFMPYQVVDVHGAEADDVIAVLVKELHKTEKILIVSADKDLSQLQKYSNVYQLNPITKKMIDIDDPEKFLYEHIIRGDSGDGIPNFLSDDDTFVTSKRQKPISTVKLEGWLSQKPEEYCDEKMIAGFVRNRKLIDFDYIPELIKNNVLNSYNKEFVVDKNRMFNYFVSAKLKNLMENIQDF